MLPLMDMRRRLIAGPRMKFHECKAPSGLLALGYERHVAPHIGQGRLEAGRSLECGWCCEGCLAHDVVPMNGPVGRRTRCESRSLNGRRRRDEQKALGLQSILIRLFPSQCTLHGRTFGDALSVSCKTWEGRWVKAGPGDAKPAPIQICIHDRPIGAVPPLTFGQSA